MFSVSACREAKAVRLQTVICRKTVFQKTQNLAYQPNRKGIVIVSQGVLYSMGDYQKSVDTCLCIDDVLEDLSLKP